MTIALALLATALFLVASRYLRLVPAARNTGTLANKSLAVLRDANLSDDEKERATRDGSIRLLWLATRLSGLLLAAFLAPVLLILAAIQSGHVTWQDMETAFLSIPFLCASTLMLFAARYLP